MTKKRNASPEFNWVRDCPEKFLPRELQDGFIRLLRTSPTILKYLGRDVLRFYVDDQERLARVIRQEVAYGNYEPCFPELFQEEIAHARQKREETQTTRAEDAPGDLVVSAESATDDPILGTHTPDSTGPLTWAASQPDDNTVHPYMKHLAASKQDSGQV